MHSEVVRRFESRVSNDRTVAWWMETRTHYSPFFLNLIPSFSSWLLVVFSLHTHARTHTHTHTSLAGPPISRPVPLLLSIRSTSYHKSNPSNAGQFVAYAWIQSPASTHSGTANVLFHGAEWPTERTPSNFGSAMIYRAPFRRIERLRETKSRLQENIVRSQNELQSYWELFQIFSRIVIKISNQSGSSRVFPSLLDILDHFQGP